MSALSLYHVPLLVHPLDLISYLAIENGKIYANYFNDFQCGEWWSSISKVMTYQLATHFFLRLATLAPDFLQTTACPINPNPCSYTN
jgi:hypothetical protein